MIDIHDEMTAEDAKMARGYLRRLVGFAIVLVAVACTAIIVTKAHAEPVYRAAAPDGIFITLHDEACALEGVVNLKRRATWTEGGKTFEGCWGARIDMGVVVAFFSDKTVVVIPLQAFQRVTSFRCCRITSPRSGSSLAWRFWVC